MLLVPEVVILLRGLIRRDQVQAHREVRKSLAHPLIAVAAEPHLLAPPLVADLVRGHLIPVTPVLIEQAQPLLDRSIPERTDRQINQHWPALPKVACTLLGKRDVVVRKLAEKL